MAYLSLYRKYRPQTFSEVVGQEHVTTTLANAVTEQRLSHAYLFTGPRGTGKTSTARILAKALNCEQGPTATPCNACTHCLAITAGSSIDVIEIDAASHGGVDDVRDLRERVAFAPASARTKVYIVDECHMLSTAGWNAFLKTVEEPPSHVLFIFATTEPHKVLETILSRTQRFDFKRVGADALAGLVRDLGEREALSFAPGTIDRIVRAGDGGVRDTLSVLDQVVAYTGDQVTVEGVTRVLGGAPDELLDEVAELVADGDVPGLCRAVQRLADAGQDLRQFARDAVEHLRSLFLIQVAPDGDLVDGTPERLERLRGLAARLGRVELLRAVELLAEAQVQMRRGNTRLPLEIALVKAALPEACGDPAALAARLDRLERRTGIDPAPVPSPVPGAAPALVREAPTVAPETSAVAPEAPALAPKTPVVAPETPAGAPEEPEETTKASPARDRTPATPRSAPAVTAQAPQEAAGAPKEAMQAPATRGRPSATPAPAPTAAPAPGPPPATAGAPTATPPEPRAAGAGLDLELLRASWPAVLEATKARTRRLHALLGEGRPVALAGEGLTLEFRPGYGYHAEYCAKDTSQATLAEVFAEVFGTPLRVRCQVAEPGGPGLASSDEPDEVAESEAAAAAGELPDLEQAHAAAVETLTRAFGATPLDRDGP